MIMWTTVTTTTIKKISLNFLLLWSLLLTGSIPIVTAQLRDSIDFEWNTIKMPFPVSDTMANYISGGPYHNDDEQGFIIITGGCNSIKGNERIQVDDNGTKIDLFECLSVTNTTLKFDPFKNTFTSMAEMPHERTRHAAAVVHGELYVIGGRDSDGNMVSAIDSYNPTTNTWTTRGALPDNLVTSDLTAWTWENYIYVSGGFLSNYTAVTTTFRLNMGDVSPPASFVFEDMELEYTKPAPTARGDVHAVTLYGYAYLVGGISHVSDWCTGLTTTERYHMGTDTWQTLANLNIGRADMAVVVLNDKIITMGGEIKPDNCTMVNDPAYGSYAANHVEVLLIHITSPEEIANTNVDVLVNNNIDNSKAATEWVYFEDFKDKRFRFTATVVPALGRIYTFGGQLPFDFTCDCFPTSNDIGIGTEVYTPEESSTTNTDSSSSLSRGGIIAIVVVGFLLFVVCIYLLIKSMEAQKSRARDGAARSNGPKADFEPTEERHVVTA